MTDIDRVIHEPVRLRILSILTGVDLADFKFLLSTLGLSKGNLSSHIDKLERAGYVEVSKGFHGKIPHTDYQITNAGRKALAGYWAVEWLVIVGMSLTVARAKTADRPFCDLCDQWTDQEQGIVYLATTADDPCWSRMEMGDVRAIEDIDFGVTDEGTSVRLNLATCSSCPESSFLSVQAVTYSVSKNGELSENTKPIFSHLQITPDAVQYLREKEKQAAAAAEQEDQDDSAEG